MTAGRGADGGAMGKPCGGNGVEGLMGGGCGGAEFILSAEGIGNGIEGVMGAGPEIGALRTAGADGGSSGFERAGPGVDGVAMRTLAWPRWEVKMGTTSSGTSTRFWRRRRGNWSGLSCCRISWSGKSTRV
jgi:hypothetical protein